MHEIGSDDSNNNIIEEIKREPYRKKVSLLDIDVVPETNNNIRVTKQTFTYDDENKLTDARVERLGMKDLSEANVTTYHYEYDANGNRTTVEIKDDGLTLESTVYTYDRLNKLVSSREVTANGLYIYEYTYDDNGSLIQEDRHRAYELNTNQWTNIRRYEYTKDNKLESVYSGNTLLVSYTYDGDGTVTSSFERDLDLNQNLNIHDTNYINRLTTNQRQLINKVSSNDSFLYELTEYITDKNRPYSETLMERDGTGHLSTIYTYGNQRISTESYNNLSGLYTYDGRGSVSAVIGGYGDFRSSYWYDGLGNVKSQIHGYGAFGSGKKYYGYNGEQYNPVTGNQNLRNRQVNIRRQRFLTEDTYLGQLTDVLSINRYAYAESNPLKYKDPSGNIPNLLEPIGNALNSAGQAIGSGVKATTNVIISGAKVLGGVITTGINAYGNLVYETRDKISFARISSMTLTSSLRFASSLTKSNIISCYNECDYEYTEYYDSNLPDYTDAINSLLYREEQNYVNYRNWSYAGQGISDLIELGGLGSVVARVRNMSYFYEQEKTGGRLDIKEEKMWNDAFNGEVAWLGQDINNPSARFLYDGQVMTADILGNVTYGYWGKALGFTDDEIYYGGGLAEQIKKNEKTIVEFIKDLNLLIPYALDELYGDAPEDHAAIKKGIDLYKERHK